MSRRISIQPATLGAVLVLILIVALFFTLQIEPKDSVAPPTPMTVKVPTWEVYFTDPNSSNADTFRGGPDASLAEAIDAAQYSVDVAIYHLDLWSVRDALIRAHRRGVHVRLVIESDYRFEAEIADLEEAGIKIIEDRREHLMHNKFVIVDRLEVWTGSMNFTVRGAYINNNHLVVVRAPELARDYTQEFEEMFLEDRFGALSAPNPLQVRIPLAGGEWMALFSPDDRVSQEFVRLINQAESSIDFMAFSFTSDEIAAAILDRVDAGVKVRGVLEASQANATGEQFSRLRDGGVDFRLDGNQGTMHHKVMILDRETVVLGSYNFTRSAEERNDENVLIAFDQGLAEQFLIEFEKIFAEATP